MKRFLQFFKPSLRRRILGSFILVAILVMITVGASYYQLVRVRQFSEQVSPTGQQMGQLQDFAISLSSLEADLEQYFVLRGVEFKEAVFVELGTLSDILDSMQGEEILGAGTTLPELAQATTQLESKVSVILGESAADLSSTQVNLGILEAYDEIDNVKRLHGQLTDETLARLQSTAVQQQNIIASVNQQSIAIGVAIFVIVLVASLFITRTLRPIGDLTQTTQAIATGDLQQRAVIHSQDEIGTLAANFNVMAEQVQELIGGLEKRVADRVRDLELSADVSRRLASIRDLDILSAVAVELVNSRFNLYHVQLYLADAAGSFLVLQAGTGDAGKDMMRRNHRLPLDSTSINGAAAFDKQTVIIPDVAASTLFRPNPLLPKTRSEMAVPLLIGGNVVGVLDLQSDEPNSLTEEKMSVFNSLASQIAIAIDNARLFTETNHAQAEIKAQARLLTRSGWRDFLEAFSQRERFGYSFDQIGNVPIANLHLGDAKQIYAQAIQLAGETIGTIEFAGNEEQHLTTEEKEMVESVAQLVAQRLENLRLLAETNRFRAEAEKAIRRLTHEGWEQYQEGIAETGYLFDQKEVKPIVKDTILVTEEAAIIQDLRVSGVTMGQMTVTGLGMDDSRAELVTGVARRLSAHIENLRLTAQTEEALAEMAKQAQRLAALNKMASELGAVVTLADAFTAVARHMDNIVAHDRLSLTLLEPDGERLKVFALSGESGATPTGITVWTAGSAIGQAIAQRRLINTADIAQRDSGDDEEEAAQGMRASLVAPLITARGVLGTLNMGSNTPGAFGDQDENIVQQIAPLLASTIENQRLFAAAQKQAEKERLVNVITQKIQNTVTMESALETAVAELGTALQARYTQVKLQTVQEKNGNGEN